MKVQKLILVYWPIAVTCIVDGTKVGGVIIIMPSACI